MPAPDTALAEAAHRLWRPVALAAAKGRLTPPREAELLLGDGDPDALDRACALLQAWCWLRGLPPLDRAIAFPRTKGAVRATMDYEPFFHALGFDVHAERVVLAYPWAKVREPSPEELLAAHASVAIHAEVLTSFRVLDLELDGREQDAARGRRRPVPRPHTDWNAVRAAHDAVASQLTNAGFSITDLRPPGAAPYPPPAPRASGREH